MKFGNSSFWIISLFWTIPALIFFYIYEFKKKQRLIEQFCQSSLRDYIIPNISWGRQRLKAFFLLVVLFFLIFSLLQPRWGFHWEKIKRHGVDIMVAVDVSSSMLAEDVKPNRLERAKRELYDLLKMMEGDRIGLIAFAGTSFVQCPLTLDYGAFKMFLEYLSPDLIPVPGTAIYRSIKTAMESFERTEKGSKAIILITDGEDHEEDPLKIAEEAKKRGIKIYPIGIGAEEGVPIPLPDGSGFKKDRDGNLILTKLDEPSLQKLAIATDGSYVRSVTGDMDLERIYLEDIRKLKQRKLGSERKKVWEERFQWFIFIALLFLVLEAIMPEKKSSQQLRFFSWKLFIFVTIFIMLSDPSLIYAKNISSRIKKAEQLYTEQQYDQALQSFIDAQIDAPENPLLQYNIANTYYRMKNYDEAFKNYMAASINAKEIDLEAKAYYNMGNCSYRLGKLQEAIEYYQKALELNPEDENAKYNLEFVREEIKRRINQQKQQQEQQEQEQQSQENKQCSQKAQTEEKPQQERADEHQANQTQEQTGGAQEERKGEGMAEEKKEEESEKEKKGGEAHAARELSEEEAKRLLDTLNEDREKFLKKIYNSGSSGYRVEKDW
ncbi:MAG: VWA domain-containing protein [bacterium]